MIGECCSHIISPLIYYTNRVFDFRLVNGVHENYLNQKMPDPNMYGVAEATSWFVFVDELQALIHSQQNYAIYPYLAHSFAAWHCLFASMAWPTIVFPSKSFEVCITAFESPISNVFSI